jgi:hypothetical protein
LAAAAAEAVGLAAAAETADFNKNVAKSFLTGIFLILKRRLLFVLVKVKRVSVTHIGCLEVKHGSRQSKMVRQ